MGANIERPMFIDLVPVKKRRGEEEEGDEDEAAAAEENRKKKTHIYTLERSSLHLCPYLSMIVRLTFLLVL